MQTYKTLSEAISDMRERGFVHTLTIQHEQIFCPELATTIAPEQLTLLERHRVQDPGAENSYREVYGFRTYENHLGIMTDTYAEYAPEEFGAILNRCKLQARSA